MIQNDLQRLRWQFLDEALRDPVLEFFMGERTATNETGNTRSLIYYVNKRLKEVNRDWSCSKRMLQNDVVFFKKKGARLMPSFRRGHKRILRYINLEWKNTLLRTSLGLDVARDTEDSFVLPPLADGPVTSINVRISTNLEAAFLTRLQNKIFYILKKMACCQIRKIHLYQDYLLNHVYILKCDYLCIPENYNSY